MTEESVFLDLIQVLTIHRFQIQKYGGMDGIRDRGLLESAIAQPAASFAGEFLHREIFEQAAAYLFHLCMNHPFVDGNKRVGLHACLVFLALNGVKLEVEHDLLFQFTCQVARGELNKQQIADFLKAADKG